MYTNNKNLITKYKSTHSYAINRAWSLKQFMHADISILCNDRMEFNSIRHKCILY